MQKALVSHLAVFLLLTACGINQKMLYADDTASDIALASPVREWELPVFPRPGIPSSPEKILGIGKVESNKLAQFLTRSNPFIEKKYAEELAKIYVEEAASEGVNHDVAFSQMCLETGFLSFGGLVTPEMNNYCGLGSTGNSRGEKFPSPRIGVRAQIQHLKIYATDAPLKNKIVDPRYHLVRPGTATNIYMLAGSWAEDKEYGKKIKKILDRLYSLSF